MLNTPPSEPEILLLMQKRWPDLPPSLHQRRLAEVGPEVMLTRLSSAAVVRGRSRARPSRTLKPADSVIAYFEAVRWESWGYSQAIYWRYTQFCASSGLEPVSESLFRKSLPVFCQEQPTRKGCLRKWKSHQLITSALATPIDKA